MRTQARCGHGHLSRFFRKHCVGFSGPDAFLTGVRGRRRGRRAARGLSSGALRPRFQARLRGTASGHGFEARRKTGSIRDPAGTLDDPDASARGYNAGTRARAASILATLILSACLAVAGSPTPAGASPYPSPTVELAGHGWCHGRGMGQYGALGYAIQQGWQYSRILDHFYGGSQPGQNPAPSMSVRLTGFDGNDTIVFQQQSHLTTPVDGGAGRYAALRAKLVGPNQV